MITNEFIRLVKEIINEKTEHEWLKTKALAY